MSNDNLPAGFKEDEGWDDEELGPEFECECGQYKNENNDVCRSCAYVNSKK